MTWVRFFLAIAPDLKDFGKLLYDRFHGDLTEARAELRRIPDYWSGEAKHRAGIDARLDAVAARNSGDPKQ